MLAAYVFCLVLGGGFLALSLLGGDHGDAAAGGDVDASLPDAGGHDLQASKIFSLRTVIYALFGFGAVGTILTLTGSGAVAALVSSIVGGAASAGVVHAAFGYLRRTDAGSHPGDDSFIGLAGTVTLPLSARTPGTVAVERGNRRFALRALPHTTAGGDDVSGWRSVVVVDMADGVARVAPVGEDLADEA